MKYFAILPSSIKIHIDIHKYVAIILQKLHICIYTFKGLKSC
jgi:hypothetical protein